MRIVDLFNSQRPIFSFEFFPPKTEAGIEKLLDTIEYLAELSPDFVSVTYGAGGGTRDLSIAVSSQIRSRFGIEPMAHITAMGHSIQEIDSIVGQLRESGVENFLGLRGDPPKGSAPGELPDMHFPFANHLIDYLTNHYGLCVGGACYPEKHIDCPTPEQDLEIAVKKVQAGAKFLVTQLFFDNQLYFDYVARARAAGIQVPIVPGIMPVTNVAQVERFAAMCGSSLPPALLSRLHRFQDDEHAVLVTGIEWATEQCRDLLAKGAPGIHFYTLNKSLATRLVFRNLK